jgi:hypothetical protein
MDVFLTAEDFDGHTLAEIAGRDDEVRGVYLRKILRGDQEIPIGPGHRPGARRRSAPRRAGGDRRACRTQHRRDRQSLGHDRFPGARLGIVAGAAFGILAA